MKRRRRVLLALVVCAFAVGVWALVWPWRQEPEYNGKKLSEWIMAYELGGGTRTGDDRAAADEAVRHISSNAVPWLVQWLRYDWPVGLAGTVRQCEMVAPRFLRGKFNTWLLEREAEKPGRGDSAVEALQVLGPSATSCVPELIRVATTMDLSAQSAIRRAGYALILLGTNSMPALVAAVRNPKQENRHILLSIIGEIRGAAGYPGAAALLESCLRDKEQQVVMSAAVALGRLRLDLTNTVPALVGLLRHPNSKIRQCAIIGLEEIGDAATPAVPQLVAALSDGDMQVRINATNSLRKIAPEALEKLR